MKNAITIQDELVSKLVSYNPKSVTYYTSTTKASKKARRELMEQGFSAEQADKLIYDCRDMASLMLAMTCGPIVKGGGGAP